MIRETTSEDLEYVKNHSISRGFFNKSPERVEYTYTSVNLGKILGIGGFQLINLYTAWVWIDLTDHSQTDRIKVVRDISSVIETLGYNLKLRRLQAYVEVDFEEAIRLVQYLGFTKEYTMKHFAGDKDAYMYVRYL